MFAVSAVETLLWNNKGNRQLYMKYKRLIDWFHSNWSKCSSACSLAANPVSERLSSDCLWMCCDEPCLRYTFADPDLVVADVQQEDEGVYTCEIITDLDMAQASGSIAIVGMTFTNPPFTCCQSSLIPCECWAWPSESFLRHDKSCVLWISWPTWRTL